ncbi:ATP-binding protein [Pendulispora albinea]|uniref:histidine kinase n=1 Tax=Pendulispora albinea TaxID=2741071 RepID=A0ABZ2LTI8_9BACT
MQAPAPSSIPAIDSAPTIGLAWLVRLRWGAVAGQAVLVLVARVALGIDFALSILAGLLGLTAASNAALAIWLGRGGRSSQQILAAVLVFDTVILTAMLHASGGAANPFSVFYLVQVALAALLLETSGTWLVALVTSIGFATLFVGFVVPSLAPAEPPTMHHGHHHGGDPSNQSFSVHLQGMWAAYTLAAIFVGYFVTRLARALERQKRDLLALQHVAAKAEKLASLSTLAAGAAHELGTPLATIAVVAKELERASERAGDAPLDRKSVADDARLLRAEAERCRTILAQMGAHAGQSQGEAPRAVSARQIAADVMAELDEARSARVAVEAGDDPSLTVVAPPRALVQVLLNVVRNGLDASEDAPAARRKVTLSLGASTRASGRPARDASFVDFAVTDEGAGIAPDMVGRLGEPFLTTKAPGRGLGLGLFLVRAFVERTGGRLDIASRLGEGTKVTLSVPARADTSAAPMDSRMATG